eukprot:CAMPEP_0178446704 /NCGR_PEP_ID=MMETSP0689_2-20121128/40967_1 /TAXON_ID=160604 /ORGANISM="Amphidinium massartii, Strain CS-259" /LENGTH=446 /DNA_ID=CAMNT_0020071589 /DNA_START=17 /DNA_END=1357 /DNA_ORIENTATION=-
MNSSRALHEIPDTTILVDFFYRPKAEAGFDYVLTHFHGDHYGRLSEAWDAPIHCSPLTGRLAAAVLGVRPDLIRHHDIGEKFELGGATVMFIDAEHCPGAVMLLATPNGMQVQHMHTGDCRATPKLLSALEHLENRKVHTLLLDSTYALSKSSFPAQDEVIEKVCADVSHISEASLILIAAYSVGKERVILRAAERIDCQIYVGSERKSNIYRVLDLSADEQRRFTSDPAKARIHIVPFHFCGEIWPYFQPNFRKCEELLDTLPMFDAVVGILPTGHADASNWNRKHEVVSRGRVTLRLYPYSEHSSAKELSSLVGCVKPVKLVPTVFRDTKEQQAIVRKFQPLLDQAGAMQQLFASSTGSSLAAKVSNPVEAADSGSKKRCWSGKRLAEAAVASPLSGVVTIALESDDDDGPQDVVACVEEVAAEIQPPPAKSSRQAEADEGELQ